MADFYEHGGVDVLDELSQGIPSQESLELLPGHSMGDGHQDSSQVATAAALAATMPAAAMLGETMVVSNAVPAYTVNVAALPHQPSFFRSAPPPVAGCYCHACSLGFCPPGAHHPAAVHLPQPGLVAAPVSRPSVPLHMAAPSASYVAVRPGPAARSQSSASRNNKRSLEEALSVASSSSDDEITVTAPIPMTIRDNSRKSGLRKKALRMQPPSPQPPVDASGTETIDIASSDDDDAPLSVQADPIPLAAEAPQVHSPEAGPCDVVSSAQATVACAAQRGQRRHRTEQSCPHAHCTCHHQPPHCVCSQWPSLPPMCPAAHYHHHSCQLHSPCPNHCPYAPRAQAASPTWWYQQSQPQPPRHRPVVHQSRRPPPVSQPSSQTHHYHANQRRPQVTTQQTDMMGVPLMQQRIYSGQQAQMERNRQASSQWYANQRRHTAAHRNPIPVDIGMYVTDWAVAPPPEPYRHPLSQSPFLAYVPPRNALFNQLTPAVLTAATRAYPVEFGMLVHPAHPAALVLGNSGFEGNFAAPSGEPQPIGASPDTIERCSQVTVYSEDGDEERCTVCLSDFEAQERIRKLHCAHLFHVDCIDRWLTYNKKCPVCRVDMDRAQGGRRRSLQV